MKQGKCNHTKAKSCGGGDMSCQKCGTIFSNDGRHIVSTYNATELNKWMGNPITSK